ncbi:ATP-binding protein [Uliginosibacterium aquaticum]|uniref:histidine kinase n=1 Tax=Uliginosibacterium aquaticum TaxID=2731212 RepID=A0ABX2IEW5_9RHOO|nr:ATP-binding protein [Uliginosibacterium aquaticum]NSL55161.1 PAS domain S-box protein [Uliginosibacterium aquaticum]
MDTLQAGDSRQSFLLLDLIEVGVLVIEGESLLFANSAFLRTVGLERSALQGHGLRELAGESWIDFTLGQSWADALPWPMADGSDRWFEVSLQPSQFGGRPVQIATCTDVTTRMRAESAEASMLQMLTEIIESYPVGTFVLDREHRISHCNRACEIITGLSANDIIGRDDAGLALGVARGEWLADKVMGSVDEASLRQRYQGRFWPSPTAEGGYEAEMFFPAHGKQSARWLHAAAAPLRDATGQIVGAIETLIDITARKAVEAELQNAHQAAESLVAERTRELQSAKSELERDIARREELELTMHEHLREVTRLNSELHLAQDQLIQSQQQLVQNEKLASIGQLAAGVAHEINNPIGYVFSNFGSLQLYLDDLLGLLDAYVAAEGMIGDEALRASLAALREKIDLAYLKEDVLDLMRESREGIERVRKIVQDLKDFSHVDASADWQWVDLHRGLESTLNVVNNEIKYKADVIRDYGVLPQIQCLPSQLNQVFMNLLVNAAHAMPEGRRGSITVRSRAEDGQVRVEIEDNGSGMAPEVMQRIFDPFFTTKPVGKGTGLGLSLSFGIIRKHHGRIEVSSTPGVGTCFTLHLPVQQTGDAADSDPDIPTGAEERP